MRKLSKILVPALMAASVLGFAGTASAQSWNDRPNADGRYSDGRYSDDRNSDGRYSDGRYSDGWHDQGRYYDHRNTYYDQRDTMDRSGLIRRQIDVLHSRIDISDRRDYLPSGQAAALRSQLRSINRQFSAFNRDGLNPRELHSLEYQINSVRIGLGMETVDIDGRRG